jgi:hypothetical protein
MGTIRDLFRGGLPRSSLAPSHLNGSGGEPLSLDERRELNALRDRRDALIREEREAETRLLRLRSELDAASVKLLEGARGQTERTVAQTVVQSLAALLPQYAKSPSWDGADLAGLARAFLADRLAQLQPSRPTLASPPQRREVETVDPAELARSITEAGRKASGDRTPRAFERGPPQPRADAADPVRLSEDIVRNGRRNS